MAKKNTIIIYILLIVCMATATIVEKYKGTEFVFNKIYGAWWFAALWAMGVAFAIFYFLERNVRRPSTIALHLSFVVILAGALLTKTTSSKGVIHLRQGEKTEKWTSLDNNKPTENALPFTICLEKFETTYHEGTNAAADYTSYIEIADGNEAIHTSISMNNIYSRKGIRLYQSGFDNDGKGSTIIMNTDRWGIPVTYTGYALLFFSLFWILIDPKGAYRNILRKLKATSAATMMLICLTIPTTANAAKVLPKETADRFGHLYVVYNNRVCPMQTLALDFTKKIYGHRHYKEYSPEQILTGFMFYPEEWASEQIIRVKSSNMQRVFGLDKYNALNAFFHTQTGEYILGPAIDEYQQGQYDKIHKAVADVDDKLMLILMEVGQARMLKIYPVPLTDSATTSITTRWFSPVDKMPDNIEQQRREYIKNSFNLLFKDAQAGNYDRMNKALDRILLYQHAYGAKSIPSSLQTKAERIYNAVPFATILFMLNLTMGFISLFYFIYRLYSNNEKDNPHKTSLLNTLVIILALSFAALTLCLALRWIVSGTIPMSNGYETMLLMAWLIMLVSFPIYRKFNIILTFSFLLSGFFLLVSHISQMDPQLSHVMPVLASPLLTIHVSIIMMAYALLALTFICGLMSIVVHLLLHSNRQQADAAIESYRLLSQLFLYPALACLGLGIFIGAIWANVSWGTYWSWDPKETWALITFMVYAIAVHDRSLPWLRRPMAYHIFMALAFMTILMTYFGVNYFLGGMHSYA